MGVLGLTPFLHKTWYSALPHVLFLTEHFSSPEVIKQLPDRLRGLTGKTIVIDGTLITQRFHFAQAPHPYRHVLGWYRLVRELNDAGVSAICVFDGKQRSLAKAREVERRKEVRRLAAARGSLENGRSKRLHRLSDVLYRFRNLDVVARERATELLRQLRPDNDIPLSAIPDSSTVFSVKEESSSPLTTASGVERESAPAYLLPSEPLSGDGSIVHTSRPEDTALLDVAALRQSFGDSLSLSSDQELLEDTEDVCANNITQHADGPVFSGTEHIKQEISPLPTAQSDLDSLGWLPHDSVIVSQEDENVNATFASLYFDFCQSISKLALLTARETSALSSPVLTVPSDLDTQAEIVMTKAQCQLTLDERNFWEHLVSSPSVITDTSDEEFSSAIEMTLANLTHTSNMMSESYQRRTNPPTVHTYEESKMIIQAMGVPCIDSVGPFEAEALASSIVLGGLADYVASEDTDVLVYDAPLIRNLTNRQSPLTVVSGSDIRMVLQLDRASFIDFALLLGTDFSQRIKKVGPARALKFIKAHGSIERVIELETKYAPNMPQNVYLAQVEVARLVYQTLPPVPEKSRLEQGRLDETTVIKILERYGLGRALMSSDWDYGTALDGNYFQDNPRAF